MFNHIKTIKINGDSITKKLPELEQEFKYLSFLNSNKYDDKYGRYSFLLALGAVKVFSEGENLIDELEKEIARKKNWLFGHFSYDQKNEIENLKSNNSQADSFGISSFFIPKIILLGRKEGEETIVLAHESTAKVEIELVLEVLNSKAEELEYKNTFRLKGRLSKAAYLDAISKVKNDISLGNVYELNYCQEFFQENVTIYPAVLYEQLNAYSPTPFSAYYKTEGNFLLCASPERYLQKEHNKIISQPIKGTAKRGITATEDEELKKHLREDKKEQNENVMIVDIVRNDLSRIAQKSSVEVEELFGAYTFPQVHQLISTIGCKLKKEASVLEPVLKSFPMGSMTGAPKYKAMQLIEEYEKMKRGIYSGSVGYISPEGNYDFNVVIRSLTYSAKRKYLSLIVGGAITALSNAEQEYEECLLKAKAIFDLAN